MPSDSAAHPLHSIFRKLAAVLFDDIVELARRDPRAFKELFHNRVDERTEFLSKIERSGRLGSPNVLITGTAGVGKSSFVHSIIQDSELMSQYKMRPLIVDYQRAAPRDLEGCLAEFFRGITEHFREIGYPINSLGENPAKDSKRAIAEVAHHLKWLESQNIDFRVLLFLDDVDYAEDDWFELLHYFLPFTRSDLVCLVLTARPPLRAYIDSYDDRFHAYTRRVQLIELSPLSVEEVLASRLAPLLEARDQHPIFSRFNSRFGRNRAAWRVIQQLDIDGVDDLPALQYPMTEKHNMFMRRITNGNLREIFAIAIESLLYIFERGDDLETRVEEEVERRVIGRQGVIDMFTKPDSEYTIKNLHAQRSEPGPDEREGNSLLFNVLQAIGIRHTLDPNFFKALERLGHTRERVELAIAHLQARENRFIFPKSVLPRGRSNPREMYPEYELSEKGQYYLQIVHWDEYIAQFGPPGRWITEVL